MQKADFFPRAIAYVVDGVIIGVVAYLISLVVSMLVSAVVVDRDSTFFGIFMGVTGIVFFVYLVFQFFYAGYFWSTSGQTPGMRLVNIKVVRRDGTEDVSLVRGGLRGTFGYWVSGFILGLGFWWALFDPNGETWHDKIFDTRVIKA